jgi:hypothetical protein
MEEIFELIKAFNRLKEKVIEISAKIDSLIASLSAVPNPERDSKYEEEYGACKILKISPRTLAKLRAEKKIPYIKHRHKILYLMEDLHEYLEKNIKR